MKIILTMDDIFQYGIIAILIIIAIVGFIVAIIDVYTREWRYKHFKCPRCNHYDGKHCDHFRNYQEECKRFSKKEKK